MTTNSDVAWLYLAALIPAAIVAFGLQTVLLWLPPQAPDWLLWSFNVLPAITGGAIVYCPVAHWTVRHIARSALGGVLGHLIRSTSMYLCFLVGAATVVNGSLNGPDVFDQFFVWAGFASLGGIVADAVISRLRTWR